MTDDNTTQSDEPDEPADDDRQPDESTNGSEPDNTSHSSDRSTGSSDPASDGGTVTGEIPTPEDYGHDHDHGHDHGFPGKDELKRWFVTTNHKDIGVLYIVTSLFFFIFGGVLALLMRIQLWTPTAPGEGVMSAIAYNQAVSAHGLIMVFFFISPFAFGLANYFVPLQLGAKDLAFPRLNALSYWLYLFSGLLFGVSFFQEATFSGGWTMYAPLNIPAYTPEVGATTAVLALVLFVVSVTVSGVNFITTMHRMRAAGLTLRRMPIFSWTILLTVWMMLFAFAALLAALMILTADRLLGTTYFMTEAGGSLLWTHLFWFFGHPEVYIVFFPALGVMAECFQTFTGQRLVGRKWFIIAMVLVTLQSFVVWMHHMFLTAINLEIKTLFMATTIGISLPFDLMVFSLIYTMIKGRIRYTTPFLFSFGALLLFIIGGITGVFLGAVVLDYEFRGTYWVVAHFHYVMVGGATALFGGLYYWFPKMTGKMYDEFLGKLHFALYFIGFNLLYFPMFLAWQTPRRVFQYDPVYTQWHQIATVGAFILGVSFLVMFYNLFTSLTAGADADDNPWQFSTTAEWAVPSPPPLENFPGIPTYDEGKLSFRSESATADVAAETTSDGVSATDGGIAEAGSGAGADASAVAEEHVESHASWWPFVMSLASFVLLLGLSGITTGRVLYITLAVLGVIGLGGSVLGMTRERFAGPEGPFGESWPFADVDNMKLGVWIFLASDVVLFGAFIGSSIFLRVAHGWTQWHHDLIPEQHVVMPGLQNTYLLLTSSFAVVLAMVFAQRQHRRGVLGSLIGTFVLGIGFLINKAREWLHLFHVEWTNGAGEVVHGWGLSTNAASSTFYLTTGLHGLHVTIGLVIVGYMIVRAWNGAYMGDDEPIELFGLYWHFVDIVWLFLFPLFYIL